MTLVTIHLPDDIATPYQPDELPRCVLEDFAAKEYARGRLTLLQLRQLLGLPSWFDAHELLHKHGVSCYTYEDYQQDIGTIDHLRP
jgi:hypothetical protein